MANSKKFCISSLQVLPAPPTFCVNVITSCLINHEPHVWSQVIGKEHVCFEYSPSKSTYKALFQGTHLGEILSSMTTVKAVPERLKSVECERGIWGKNSPICYIPEQDPIQDPLISLEEASVWLVDLVNSIEWSMSRGHGCISDDVHWQLGRDVWFSRLFACHGQVDPWSVLSRIVST
jgi:hypothetical protein